MPYPDGADPGRPELLLVDCVVLDDTGHVCYSIRFEDRLLAVDLDEPNQAATIKNISDALAIGDLALIAEVTWGRDPNGSQDWIVTIMCDPMPLKSSHQIGLIRNVHLPEPAPWYETAVVETIERYIRLGFATLFSAE